MVGGPRRTAEPAGARPEGADRARRLSEVEAERATGAGGARPNQENSKNRPNEGQSPLLLSAMHNPEHAFFQDLVGTHAEALHAFTDALVMVD